MLRSDSRVKARLRAMLFAVLAMALPGCASYQLGTGSGPTFRTLFIEPVRVEALVPQAQVAVGTQLRETFLRDGRVRLAGSSDSADAVLAIVLDRYERAVATVRPDDTGLARRFDVELIARATLTDRRTGKVIFANRPLVARRGVFTDSGLVPAEYQNLPLLAQDLARQAQQAVLDTW
ncbi:MAG TPA: LPS assembly lipoprotein LptE [Opitutaceae bacterium]|nr:LPS assembly lipoprotein LptE [Opitutaceae bacterium]